MTDPLPIALTHAQRNMLETLAQLPNHWHAVTAKEDVKACDDLVTLRLIRNDGKLYRVTVYGLSELEVLRGE